MCKKKIVALMFSIVMLFSLTAFKNEKPNANPLVNHMIFKTIDGDSVSISNIKGWETAEGINGGYNTQVLKNTNLNSLLTVNVSYSTFPSADEFFKLISSTDESEALKFNNIKLENSDLGKILSTDVNHINEDSTITSTIQMKLFNKKGTITLYSQALDKSSDNLITIDLLKDMMYEIATPIL